MKKTLSLLLLTSAFLLTPQISNASEVKEEAESMPAVVAPVPPALSAPIPQPVTVESISVDLKPGEVMTLADITTLEKIRNQNGKMSGIAINPGQRIPLAQLQLIATLEADADKKAEEAKKAAAEAAKKAEEQKKAEEDDEGIIHHLLGAAEDVLDFALNRGKDIITVATGAAGLIEGAIDLLQGDDDEAKMDASGDHSNIAATKTADGEKKKKKKKKKKKNKKKKSDKIDVQAA